MKTINAPAAVKTDRFDELDRWSRRYYGYDTGKIKRCARRKERHVLNAVDLSDMSYGMTSMLRTEVEALPVKSAKSKVRAVRKVPMFLLPEFCGKTSKASNDGHFVQVTLD